MRLGGQPGAGFLRKSETREAERTTSGERCMTLTTAPGTPVADRNAGAEPRLGALWAGSGCGDDPMSGLQFHGGHPTGGIFMTAFGSIIAYYRRNRH